MVERRGVATSVLKKVGAEWKIISMHKAAASRREADMRTIFHRAIVMLFALLFVTASPALAHKDHKKAAAAVAVPAPVAAQAGAAAVTVQPGAQVTVSTDPAVAHEQRSEMMEAMADDRAKMTSSAGSAARWCTEWIM